YVAEAMRMGLRILPPDINASAFRCTGKDRDIRIGLQFVKGLSANAVERILPVQPFTSIFDLRVRTRIAPGDLRLLIKVGALDSIAQRWTRPMMLWMAGARRQRGSADWFDDLPPAVPVLQEYSPERRRRA